ncbi:MAG: family 16 glycoside hydrolase [Rubripirellula sp.]
MRQLLFLVTFFLLCVSTSWAQSIVTETLPAEVQTDWTQVSFWETVDGKPAERSWAFQGGEIQLVKPRGGSGSLLSGPLPSNFELSYEWKIDDKTNSGLKYRVRKYGKKWLGLEYQMIDEGEGESGKGSTASIYDLVGPDSDKPLQPAGQWNRSRIVASGHHIEHHLNGKLVSQIETIGPVWERMLAVSKFWGNDGFAGPQQDSRIMLTDHGGKATFRKFQFTARQAPEPNKLVGHSPYLANAIRNGWADQNSIVLWTRTTANPEFLQDGLRFKSISTSEAKRLAKLRDPDELNALQLPAGARLEEMFGACPGVAGEVRLTYFPTLQRNAAKTTDWVTTDAKTDFTAQWKLQDLKPGREYAAVVEARPIGGEQPTAVVRGGFKTAANASHTKGIKFCMTTCHDFLRRDDGLKGHKIYPAMTELDPDFVVHAGDIEYYDKPDPWAWTEELMEFKWGRIFALPSNRDFYSRTTSYFIKDDHDTLKNDCWAGQFYGSVSFERGLEIFNQEQFPSHAPRYKTVRWGGDLQIWMLEGRDFRSPNDIPDGPEKTILGREQKAWLYRTLQESDAAFKLIFSPTPIVGPDRNNKKDNHANEIFVHEGNELRRELSKHQGAIILCGDRHWQYASVGAESGLWEFGCGPGSEKHHFGWKKGDVRPVHRFLRVAGGFLSGEVTYSGGKRRVPKLTLQHRKVTGESVSEFVFPVQDEQSEQ